MTTTIPVPDELAPSVAGGKVTDVSHVRGAATDASAVAAMPYATRVTAGKDQDDFDRPRRHGILCDGTDESVAFQAMVNTVSANSEGQYGGGTIQLAPDKVLKIQDVIMRSHVALVGVTNSYAGRSRIDVASAGHAALCFQESTKQCSIRHLEISGSHIGLDKGTSGMKFFIPGYPAVNNALFITSNDVCFRGLDVGVLMGLDTLATVVNGQNLHGNSFRGCQFTECAVGLAAGSVNWTGWEIAECGIGARDVGILLRLADFGQITNCAGSCSGVDSAFIRIEQCGLLNIQCCQNETATWQLDVTATGGGRKRIIRRNCHLTLNDRIRADVDMTFDNCAIANTYTCTLSENATSSNIWVRDAPVNAAQFNLIGNSVIAQNGNRRQLTQLLPEGLPSIAGAALTTSDATIHSADIRPFTGWYTARLVATATTPTSVTVVLYHISKAGFQVRTLHAAAPVGAGETDLGTHNFYSGGAISVNAYAADAASVRLDTFIDRADVAGTVT